MRRFSAARQKELRTFAKTLVVRQPNFGKCLCAECDLAFASEAAFTFHRRTQGPRLGTACMTEAQLRRRLFTGDRVLRAPAWVEYWMLDELDKEMRHALSGFTKEAWVT